jgi:hypothetical protein
MGLTTQEAESRRIEVQSRPEQSSEDPILKILNAKKG